MRVLALTERLIYESRAWKFIAAIAAVALFKTGIWYIPNLGASQAIAQNPFTNPFVDPDAHYLFWRWLGPFLAWVVGANGQWSFFLFHLVIAIAFWLLFVGVAMTRFPDRTARSAIVLFSILPASATVFFWVGYDSITLFLMMLALAFPRRALITLGAGIGIGMQNSEQGVFAAAGLLVAVVLARRFGTAVRYDWSFCVWLLLGVVTGRLVLIGVFAYNGIQVNAGSIYWVIQNLNLVLKAFFFHFQAIVYSALGLGWLMAARYLDWRRRAIPFFVVLLGLCLLLPLSGDTTRVFAVVTFPLIAVFWLLNDEVLGAISTKEIAGLTILWAILPMSWVWLGVERWSVLPYDIASALHLLFGWFHIPPNPELWPFGAG
jgi:hypothetical protein